MVPLVVGQGGVGRQRVVNMLWTNAQAQGIGNCLDRYNLGRALHASEHGGVMS